jgi:hypothetical protein
MLDHIMTKHDPFDAPILDRRAIDRALDTIDIRHAADVFFHHAVHGVGQFEADDVPCTALAHPEALHAAASPCIDDDFSLERIGGPERVFYRVFEPVQLELVEIEIIPFVTERIDRGLDGHIFHEPGNPGDDPVTIS